VSIAITADHGMNAKTRALSPEAILAAHGIAAVSVSTLQDRYTKHHGNMSGSAYVHLDAAERDRAADILRDQPGIERVLMREEAAEEFHLDAARIGDLVLLGDVDTAFGGGDEPEREIAIRSHGSLHEQAIPLITWGPRFAGFDGTENRSIGEWLHRQYDAMASSTQQVAVDAAQEAIR
jgi:phosphonoacetate hydrolase